jgi:sulfatase maturation enzyme AslB (radical SAM superfamily)
MDKFIPIFDTKCVAPYIAVEVNTTGKLQVCCEYVPDENEPEVDFTNYEHWKNNLLTNLRVDLANNIRHQGCSHCWQKDDINSASLRTHLNKLYSDVYDKIGCVDDKDLFDSKYVHAHFGNMCNLKCVMCNSQSSSSIEAEYKLYSKQYLNFYHEKFGPSHNHEIDKNFSSLFYKQQTYLDFLAEKFAKADNIYLTGGEPLMTPEAYDTLNSIQFPQNKVLTLTTNGTLINKKWIDLFNKFKHVSIVISIDGIGSQNDYVRFGSDWNILQQNIFDLKNTLDKKFNIAVATVIQHTSFYTLKNIIEFVYQHNLKLHFSVNNGYRHMRINTLTPEEMHSWKNELTDLENRILLDDHPFKENYIEVIKAVIKLIDKEYQFDSEHRPIFFEYLKLLDSIRKTNFNEIFKK